MVCMCPERVERFLASSAPNWQLRPLPLPLLRAGGGDLQTVLRPSILKEDFLSEPIFDRIKREISENPIMVYMKGTPEFPQCGFSGATVRIFELLKTPIASRNVLEDPELRDGIKRFSNWPTIPQVYIGGNFIGGSDIMREMYQSGELAELVKKTLEG